MKKAVIAFLFILLFFSCNGREKESPFITIALENSPGSLDPRIGTDQVSQRIHQLLYRGLVRREKDMSLVPDMALRFYMRDEKEWVFELRKGLHFSDGRPITSRDVVFTFQSIISGRIKTLRKAAFTSLEAIRAEGKNRVVFRLKEPYASFLINLTLGIIPEGADQNFGLHPVSSGPYMVERMEKDEILLVPNPYYEGEVKNRGIRIRIIPDQITRSLELKKGAVDIVVNGFSPDVVYVLEKQEGIKVKREKGGNFAYIGINFRDRALSKKEVRKAIGYGINREEIIASLLRGYAQPADTIIPPMHWAHEKDLFRFSYAPEKARRLLKKAGYGEGLELELKCASNAFARTVAEVLQWQLSRIGVKLKINCLEFSAFYQQVVRGNSQLYFLMWVGISDPDIFYYTLHSRSIPPNGANRGFFKNPLLDKLIEEARRTFDLNKRKKLYSRIQKIVAEEVPFIPLWYPDSIAVYREELEGVEVYPCGDLLFMRKLKKKLPSLEK